ncbi:MAG: hypothetical protein ABI668_09055 [Sphingorhabdus sp.]
MAFANDDAVEFDMDIGEFASNSDSHRLSKTTALDVSVKSSLKGWDLSMAVSYNRTQGDPRSTVDFRPLASKTPLRPNTESVSTGLTDLKISAERSVPITRKVSLDLLARATLPTGKTSNYLGAGRFEAMLDAGLSTNVAKADIWAGVARRFRTKGFDTPGRDINEFYAGISRTINKKTDIRFDYLLAQSPYRGERAEQTISAGVSRTLKSDARLALSASKISDIYGKRTQATVSVSYPFKNLV